MFKKMFNKMFKIVSEINKPEQYKPITISCTTVRPDVRFSSMSGKEVQTYMKDNKITGEKFLSSEMQGLSYYKILDILNKLPVNDKNRLIDALLSQTNNQSESKINKINKINDKLNKRLNSKSDNKLTSRKIISTGSQFQLGKKEA